MKTTIRTFIMTLAIISVLFTPLSFSQSVDASHVVSDVGTAVASGVAAQIFPFHAASSQGIGAEGAPVLSEAGVLGRPQDLDGMSRKIVQGIVALSDPDTHLAPSHFGSPGFEDAAFIYDKAVDALVLYAGGDELQARAVLEYFAARLRIPIKEVIRNADANGIYGILKLVPSVDNPKAVGLVNAVNRRSLEEAGQGQIEFWTTPGPLAFMIFAFLSVDRTAYLPQARKLGEAILQMQRADGAVMDGDRNALNVNIEPHMDAFCAFLMLYDVTGNKKWKDAAERAWEWFFKNAYRPGQEFIYRNIGPGGAGEVFATDAYSWTMAGRGGDRLPLEMLERLTDRMLRRSLSQITLELPDGKIRTVTLVDFTDVQDVRINADRGGFHPMGSVEWIGGVILALQKNAVRFGESPDAAYRQKARFYKALAEFFIGQALGSFYELDGIKGVLSFYATGQWVPTGHGWKTPYFYVKDPAGKPVIKGGSTISSWPVLPLKRLNPFQLDDPYGRSYEAIAVDEDDRGKASAYVAQVSFERAFMEHVPTEVASDATDMPEMWRYNLNMFRAFEKGDYYAAILWAQKVTGNKGWVKLAADQEARKQHDLGGLVDYPWGTPKANAKAQLGAIGKYPLLNEMGAAMWGLAVSQFKLGNRTEAKAWIRTLIETVPLHQIFAPSGPGYWNALVSWENNPGGTVLDAEMGAAYREVLADMGLISAVPDTVSVK